jgi:hypothetical protein
MERSQKTEKSKLKQKSKQITKWTESQADKAHGKLNTTGTEEHK